MHSFYQVLWLPLSIVRILLIIITMAVFIVGYLTSLLFTKHSRSRALRLRENWLKYLVIPILGIRAEVVGKPITSPALYVSNHRSFTDPIVICRYLKAFVIAKAEVSSYPLISYGAQLTGVIFVKRTDKDSRSAVRKEMVDTIHGGNNVLVFPEGTIGSKKGTLELRIGAFAEAFNNNIPIIPIVIEYQRPEDLWTVSNFVVQFTWMFAKPITRVKLKFGDPISATDVPNLVQNIQLWMESSLDQMQENWSLINYDNYKV